MRVPRSVSSRRIHGRAVRREGHPRCFCCFCRKFTASGGLSPAETLGSLRRRRQKTAKKSPSGCYLLSLVDVIVYIAYSYCPRGADVAIALNDPLPTITSQQFLFKQNSMSEMRLSRAKRALR